MAHAISSMRIRLFLLALRLAGYLSRTKARLAGLLALALLCATLLLAQSFNFVQIVQPPPPGVANAGAVYTGPRGNTPIYYWIVARYPVGASAIPTGPIVASGTNGAQNLGGGATVTVSWSAATAATGYDVLRSTTPAAPIPCANCAVALNTALTSVTDSGAAGSAYPPGGLVVASNAVATIAVNNRDGAAPYAYVQIGSTIVPITPGLAPVTSVFGRVGAVVATVGDYAFSQLSGFLALSQIDSANKQGNGTKIQFFAGSAPSTNDCAKFDANGNIATAGAPCGSGGGGVTSFIGRTGAVVAAINDYAFSQLSGFLALSQIDSANKQGNGTKIQFFAGSAPSTGDCAEFDANGNVVTAGAPCAASSANPSQSFTSQTSVAFAHNLNSMNVLVACYNGSNVFIEPSSLTLTDVNTATITFGQAQTGRCVANSTGGGGGGGGGGGYTAGTGVDAAQLASNIIAVNQSTVAPIPLNFTFSHNFTSISDGDCGEYTATGLAGVMPGDVLVVGANPPPAAGLQLPNGKASTTPGEAVIALCNYSGAPVDPPDMTFRVVKPVTSW